MRNKIEFFWSVWARAFCQILRLRLNWDESEWVREEQKAWKWNKWFFCSAIFHALLLLFVWYIPFNKIALTTRNRRSWNMKNDSSFVLFILSYFVPFEQRKKNRKDRMNDENELCGHKPNMGDIKLLFYWSSCLVSFNKWHNRRRERNEQPATH